MNKIVKLLADSRIYILGISGTLLYAAIGYFHISLWWILLAGVLSGIVFGKVFCRWVCPMGLLMEVMMNLMGSDGKIRQMYMYHKVGCPIAWISGWLNRLSVFRIRISKESCISCCKCDKQCYIVAMEPQKYSLYKPGKADPGESYTCSKCLQCVAACPNGSLRFR